MTNKKQIAFMSMNNKRWFTRSSPIPLQGVDKDLFDNKVEIFKVEQRFPALFHM